MQSQNSVIIEMGIFNLPQQKSVEQIIQSIKLKNHPVNKMWDHYHKITEACLHRRQWINIEPYYRVMLKNLDSIRPSIKTNVKYIWIGFNLDHIQNEEEFKNRVILEINPIFCPSVEQLLINIQLQINQTFKIITNFKFAQEVCKRLKDYSNVIQIDIICDYYPVGKFVIKQEGKIKFCNLGINQLIPKIVEQKSYDSKYLWLPNFAAIHRDNKRGSLYKYNLYGMLLTTSESEAKKDFIDLLKYLHNNQKEQNQVSILEKQINSNNTKILDSYKKSPFLCGFLNKFIKLSSDPLQTAYIRYPIQSIFKQIKHIYKQNRKIEAFYTYRSGFMNEQDLEYLKNHIGDHVQFYGFIHTTTDYIKARECTDNFFITFHVQQFDTNNISKLDYGYIFLDNNQYPYQKQVLFNALSTFKIISIVNQKNINFITLKYSQLAQLKDESSRKVIQYKQAVLEYKHNEQIKKNIKNQGDILYYCKMWKQASEYYQYEIEINHFIYNGIQLARIFYKIGVAEQQQRSYPNAIRAYSQSLQIQLHLLSINHLSTANTIKRIGLLYLLMGDYQKAISFYSITLKIQLSLLGNNHMYISNTLSSIGQAFMKTEKYNKALPSYLKAFQIRKSILGEKHTFTIETLNNIGSIYEFKEEFENALKFYRRALNIQLQHFEENYDQSVHLLNNIGSVYKKKGSYQVAIENYERAIKIQMKLVRDNHPLTALLFNNIGSVYEMMGQFDKSLEYFQKCLKIQINLYGQNHLSSATTLSNIGSIYSKKKQYNNALEHYSKVLGIRLKILGKNDLSIAITFNNIGLVYQQKKQYHMALMCYEKALKIQLSTIGEHSYTAITYCNIGSIYFKKGQYMKAAEYQHLALKILIIKLGEYHSSVAIVFDHLGQISMKTKQYTKALEYWNKSYQIKRKILEQKDKRIINSKKIIKKCRQKLAQKQ